MQDFKEKHFDLSHNVDCTSSSSSSSISSTCKLVYVIEGNLASVKRCGGPTHLEAEEAVSNLELSGYTVLRTTGMAQTINAVVSELKRLEALSLSSQQGQQSRKSAESKSSRIDDIDANQRAPDTDPEKNYVHLQVPVVVTSPPLIEAESEIDTLLSSSSIDYRQTAHMPFSKDTHKKVHRDDSGNHFSKCSLKRQRTASGSQYDAIQVDDSSEDENSDVIFVCERPGGIDCSSKQSDGCKNKGICRVDYIPTQTVGCKKKVISNGNMHALSNNSDDEDDLLTFKAFPSRLPQGKSSVKNNLSDQMQIDDTNYGTASSTNKRKKMRKKGGDPSTNLKSSLDTRFNCSSFTNVFQERKASGYYVPRANSCFAAILVALLLYEDEWLQKHGGANRVGDESQYDKMPMLSKEDIMHRADKLGIAVRPMEGIQHENQIQKPMTHFAQWPCTCHFS